MSKALPISFSVKSATTLASRLGVSKSRAQRIFAIVAKAEGKNGLTATGSSNKGKANAGSPAKRTGKTSPSKRRTHAKNAKAAR